MRFGDQQNNEKEGASVTEPAEGTLLWEPSEEFKENANISRYIRWLKQEKNLSFDSYEELWEWSVTDLEGFWVPYGSTST